MQKLISGNKSVVYGALTPDLAPDADPLDDCILANRNPRFRGLSPDGYDDIQGHKIRAQFFEPQNLARAYNFCLNLSRAGNLTEK